MSQQTTDVLEQKARECRIAKGFTPKELMSHLQAENLMAAFALEIVEQCAKAVCVDCASGYAYRLGSHYSKQDYFINRCQAEAIWEAFGRKDSNA